MKKLLVLSALVLVLIPSGSVLAQTLSDYVEQVKGDTLVIKDYSDMNNQPNSLYEALLLDSLNVPAGRVYELKAGGLYPLAINPTTRLNRNTVIVGSDPTMLVNNKNAGSSPPLICGASASGSRPITSTGGIAAGGDLTIKNCALVPAADDGSMGWAFTYTTAPDLHLVFDNVLFERTRWVFVDITNPGCNVTFRNCYFVNMSGQPCRRSGGIFDCFADLDTLLVENCTSIMATGSLYRFRGYPGDYQYSYKFNRIIINHNTFVDCAGYVFMNPGLQSNVSFTNNIFVNSNVQPYPALHSIDGHEQDPDWLPMGLVNVYPDSADAANNTPRKFLCQDNLVYWDPSFADMDSILDAHNVNGVTKWRSQMIIMNARTDSMFKHVEPYDAKPYSYLVTDAWNNRMPAFTDPKDLVTTQLTTFKAFALSTVDTNSRDVLPDWRLVNTGTDKFIYPDWPIPVDLSYSDADLRTAGIGGFPIGDLNWFPDKKTLWLSKRDKEYAAIRDALDNGTLVIADVHGPVSDVPAGFQLGQNYPNPFNPGTMISYKLPVPGRVVLKVYDVLGREVETLVNEHQSVGNHSVAFDGTNLPSGVYFYRLQTGSYTATKKLLLLK